MINWKQKLSSRKFWVLLAALVVSCVVAFGLDSGTVEKITGILTAVGSCMVYMLAEAKTDAAYSKNSSAAVDMDAIIKEVAAMLDGSQIEE